VTVLPPLHTRALLLLLLAAAGFIGCRGDAADTPAAPRVSEARLPDADAPNFLVIDIDTMRADRRGLTRGGQSITPTLDALASQGATFSQAYSQSAWTMPAVFSLLTGRYPLLQEVRDDTLPRWDDKVRSVADIVSYYGYRTAVWWGATLLAGDPEYSRGFADRSEPCGRDSDAAGAYDVPLAGWIQEDRDRPFLAMVHNIDLHRPRPAVPEAWLHRYTDEPVDCPLHPLNRVLDQVSASAGPETGRRHAIDHYDGSVSYYDQLVAGYLEQLDEAGVREDTVIVVLSDHGEELFEHGRLEHGSHYETVLRIPLIVVDPRLEPSGRVIETPVQTVDVAPTILARAGIPPSHDMDGQSLLPLLGLGDGDYESRPIFSLTDRYHSSVRSGDLKVLTRSRHGRKPGGVGEPAGARELVFEAYDLANDPGETRDLMTPDPAALVDDLATQLVTWRQTRFRDTAGAPRRAFSEELQDNIRENGYWDKLEPDRPPKPVRAE
jgi:choline-sulfatase